MKIPQYKRQVGFPKQTGAQFLSARANPGSFAAPGAAFADLGGTIQTEGFRWLQKEIQTEQAAIQAQNENNFRSLLSNTRIQTAEQPVNEWTDGTYSKKVPRPGVPNSVIDIAHQIQPYKERRAFIERGLYDHANRMASRIKNKTARQRFLTTAHRDIAAFMPQLSADMRKRYKDYANGVFVENITKLERDIAMMPKGNVRNLRQKELAERIVYWAGFGNFTAEETAKEIKQSGKRIDTHNLNERYANAKTPEDADAILLELERGDTWENIDADTVGKWMAKVSNRGDQLNNREIARREKEANRQEKEFDKQREATYEDYSLRITAARDDLSKGVTPGETLDEIRGEVITKMDNRTFVRPEDGAKLLEMIDGQDTIFDQDYYIEMGQKIDEALTETDLDALRDEVQKQRKTRRIGGKSYMALDKHIKLRRGKTHQTTRQKSYRTTLSKMLGSTMEDQLMQKLNLSSKNGAEKVDAALSLKYYDDLVRIENQRPAQAFYNTIMRHFDADLQEVVAKNILKSLPDTIAETLGYNPAVELNTEGMSVYLKENITTQNLSAARKQLLLWTQGKDLPDEVFRKTDDGKTPSIDDLGMLQREDTITPKQRLTARRLYEIEHQLKMLEQYKPTNELIEPPLVEPTGNEKADEAAQGESDDSWALKAVRWFNKVLPEELGGDPSTDADKKTDFSDRGMAGK